MHCQRYHAAPLTRRELLMQAAFGFGGVALTALAADKAFGGQIESRNEPADGSKNPACAAAAPFSGEGEERHLPVHGRRAVAGRYVRPQAAARQAPRQSRYDVIDGRADAVQQHRRRSASRRGSSSSTARAAFRSAICFRTSPSMSTTWPSSASMIVQFPRTHERQLLPAHRHRPAGPAEHGRVGHLRPGQRMPELAGLRGSQRRADSARRARQFRQRLSAGRLIKARSFAPATQPVANITPQEAHAGLQREQARPDAEARPACSAASARSTRSNRRSPTTSWPAGCKRPCRS